MFTKQIVLSVIVEILLVAGATAVIAKSKGRSPMKWFLLGVIFNVFTLTVISAIKSYTGRRQ